MPFFCLRQELKEAMQCNVCRSAPSVTCCLDYSIVNEVCFRSYWALFACTGTGTGDWRIGMGMGIWLSYLFSELKVAKTMLMSSTTKCCQCLSLKISWTIEKEHIIFISSSRSLSFSSFRAYLIGWMEHRIFCLVISNLNTIPKTGFCLYLKKSCTIKKFSRSCDWSFHKYEMGGCIHINVCI